MKVKHLDVIARYWDDNAERYFRTHPEHPDAESHPSWGMWHLPEKTLGVLKDELSPGKRLVDLGCGIGHDAVGFASMGLDVLAVDISKEQIGRAIPHKRVTYAVAGAENLPVPDNYFDIAVCDHGAFDHSPAELLLTELRRVLRPGGILALCTYSPLMQSCYSSKDRYVGRELINPYPSSTSKFDGLIVSSEKNYAEWVRCFRSFEFDIEQLEELMPPADSKNYFDEVIDADWASKWPSEILWVVRKK